MRTHAFKAGARKARLRARQRPPAKTAEPANDYVAAEDVAPALEPEAAPVSARAIPLNDPPPLPANDTLALDDNAPPFDPPDEDDILGLSESYDDDFVDDDAPFDAPDDIEECVGAMHVAPARELPLIELTELVDAPPVRPAPMSFAPAAQRAEPAADLPTPPIVVHASWDRTESGEMFAAFADDKRVARAEISIARGGVDGAAAELNAGVTPDLFIIDTDLSGAEMLVGVGALLDRMEAGAKVIVIGAVNDIGVLRALQQRGVVAYLMAPVSADDLARAVCDLFAQTDRSRVIAVMGARGGVGASTLAQNLAWTIADKLDAPTALVDLDIGFGAAAETFKLEPQGFITDLLDGGADDAALDRALTPAHDRLLIGAAPGAPDLGLAVDEAAFTAMLARVRRTSAFVVLDVPHVWTSWVKQALVAADEIVLVAGADLASLRNSDNLIKLLRDAREGRAEPLLALSMTGVPKRPEIAAKEFAEAVCIEPVATFAFDPELYGEAETSGRLLVNAAPQSKQAQAIEMLACGLTGRTPVEHKRKPRRETPAPAETALAPQAPLVLETKDEAPDVAAPEVACEPVSTPAPAAPIEQNTAPSPPPRREDDGLSDFERAYVEKARRRAMAELDTRRSKRRRRRGDSRTLVRFLGVTAAASALMLVVSWSERERTQEAPVQTVALPAAPADPFAALAADYAQAMTLLAENDARGLPLLRRTAQAGSALAQYRLAKLYESGDGVEMDVIAARQWTERAAGGGNVRAMHDLGFYYARGDGAPLDDAAAFRWFRQAAEFGFPDSQYNLGVLYEQGLGVSADIAEALFWFTLAANQGDVAAVERVTQIQGDLTGLQIEQARARADAFRPRAPNAIANE